MMPAAGYKEADPDPRTVCNITFFNISVIHPALLSDRPKKRLQMKHPVSDLLSSSLIPELGSDIAAGSAGYKHVVLILIAAVGAFPDKLSGFILLNYHLPS